MKFAVIDTETSGLLDDPDARVVEVGVAVFDTDTAERVVPVGVDGVSDEQQAALVAARVEGGLVWSGGLVRTWSSLVWPGVLTAEGEKVLRMISKIDPDAVRAARGPEQVLAEMAQVIGDLPVRAYNMGFDHPMFVRTFGSFPWAQAPIAWLDSEGGWDGSHSEDAVNGESGAWRQWPGCIMEAFVVRFRPFTRMHEDGKPYFVRLSAVVRLLGLSVGGEGDGALHRAAFDAALAGRIAIALDRGARAVDVMCDGIETEREAFVLPDADLIEVGAAWRGASELSEEGAFEVGVEARPALPDVPEWEVT